MKTVIWIIAKAGQKPPEDYERYDVEYEIEHSIHLRTIDPVAYEMLNIDSPWKSFEESGRSHQYRYWGFNGHPLDPEDELGRTARQQFPNTKIVHLDVVAEYENYHCILVFTFSGFSEYTRPMIFDPKTPFQLGHTPTSIPSREVTESTDVRELLACKGYKRLITLAAGSPGWDSNTSDRSRSSQFVSRSAGKLDATQNDFSVILNLLQGFTLDDVLPGITCVGLVRSKLTLFNLLKHSTKVALEGSSELEREIIKDSAFSGVIIQDAKLKNAVISGSTIAKYGQIDMTPDGHVRMEGMYLAGTRGSGGISVMDTRGMKIDRLIGDDFYTNDKNTDSHLPYALLYYAGHGDKSGALQIEETQNITALELFNWSYRNQIPLVIILDMCYSHLFGHEYAMLLRQHAWNGVVLASNDGSTGGYFSFESDEMWRVRRPELLIKIAKTENAAGHGVFSAALALALLKIRENEKASGNHIHISLKDFVNHFLFPICQSLHQEFDVPLQKPVLFT